MSKSRTRRQSRDPQFEALTKEVVELRAKVAQNEAASVTAKLAAARKLARRPKLAFAEFVPLVEEEPRPPAAQPHYQTTATAKLTKSVDAFRLNEDPAARLAFEVDPHDAIAQSVYVPKTRGVSDQVLRRIGIQESLVACILHARGHQMAAHGNPRRDRFSFGYTIQLTPAAQAELSTKEKEDLQPEIQRAIKALATCGREDVPRKNRCTLGRWLYESTRDGLLLGRFATEVVYQPDSVDGKSKFEYFRPIDAATIYRVAPQGTEAARQVRVQSKQLLQRIDDEALPDENFLERFFEDEFAWVQVINGQPMQAFTEDQCLVHAFYPVTDVEAQGYPLTPIDTAISEVTTRLAITTHNRLYFQSGRASRGALVITSEDIDDTILQDMRQKFSASINGVSNCLDGRTVIWTPEGLVSLEKHLGDQSEKLVKLWTPYGWQSGLIYRSSKKKLTETTLSNGTVLRMSPDHRVMSVNEEGEMEWRRQEDLSVEDFVLLGAQNVQSEGAAPLLNDREVDTDLAEVLGWMTGDGTFNHRGLSLFYHHDKEEAILDRHLSILERWGFPAVKVETALSEEEQKKICDRYKFKSCASRRIRIKMFSREWSSKLKDLGFTFSKAGVDSIGKSVPAWLHTAPKALKTAFLRGLFSADGSNEKTGGSRINPKLTCSNHRLREQVRLLLLSMGIRTCLTQGKTKGRIGGGRTAGQSFLKIKDRSRFFADIGFIQNHKQPPAIIVDGNSDWIPPALAVKFARIIKNLTTKPHGSRRKLDGSIFAKSEHMLLNAIIRGDDICSKTRLLGLAARAGHELPKWVVDSHFEKVISKVDTQTEVDMFDVAVYEPTHGCTGLDCKAKEHAFFADGVHTANSHRLPIFALAPGESAQWVSMDGPKDMEFQYLSDQNARTLLSVFQMSPEELPGYSHLSRGTATQALAECLSPESEVLTDTGTRKLGEILGNYDEEFFKIWTGRCWSEARVFRSGSKLLRTTKLHGGSSIDTSPDHRFMRVGEDGRPGWVHQEELSVGDWVLVESDERWKIFAAFLKLWYSFEIPEWFNFFHPEQVSELIEHPYSIQMVDVEVFDEHHGFVSAGFYLHNSNQEYLLEAHRDLGIRPLIEHFQGFLTNEILPLIAPSLVKHCEVRLLGLGAESAEKESVRIQQDLPVHLTFNEVMGRVEKEPVPRAVAGDVPLNPQWGAVCDKMVPLNEQQAVFLAKDQEEAKRYRESLGTRYLRDPFWWQMRQDLWQQFQILTTQALPLAQFALPPVIRELFPSVPEKELPQMAQQLVMQAEQMMQQQQAAQAGGGQEGGGGGDPGQDGGQPPQDDGGGQPSGDPQAQQQPQDGGLGQDLQNAQDSLGKSERQLGRAERRALDAHKRAVSSTLSNFRREARMATMQIIGEVNKRRTGGTN